MPMTCALRQPCMGAKMNNAPMLLSFRSAIQRSARCYATGKGFGARWTIRPTGNITARLDDEVGRLRAAPLLRSSNRPTVQPSRACARACTHARVWLPLHVSTSTFLNSTYQGWTVGQGEQWQQLSTSNLVVQPCEVRKVRRRTPARIAAAICLVPRSTFLTGRTNRDE